jgi:hypothetical protein
MKLKLIILLIIASSLSFGQDGLQHDSKFKPFKSHATKGIKKRKKGQQLTRENIIDTGIKGKSIDINNVEKNINTNTRTYTIPILLILGLAAILMFKYSRTELKRWRPPEYSKDEGFMSDLLMRLFKSRRDYYREEYLKSDAWQRKRYVVFRRDNWSCVHCVARATQVHHKRYAKNIGKEPIEWLESICKSCHDSMHP